LRQTIAHPSHDPELRELTDPGRFFEENGVGLFDGSFFRSLGFVRLNFGCPAAILKNGLDRMAQALKRRSG
jgi:cystathionine beta-lyase